MGVNANLRIILLANDVSVAETDDAVLWQKVLAEINAPQGVKRSVLASLPVGHSEALEKFASELGVSAEMLQGACSPSERPPYITLDAHCFAAFRNNFPLTGPNAVSGAVLAGTLLVLWGRQRQIEQISNQNIQQVLATVGAESLSINRSLRRCVWLQLRDGALRLNPAEISRAEAVARAFCTKATITEAIS